MTLYRYAIAYAVLLAGPLAVLRLAMRPRRRPRPYLPPPPWLAAAFAEQLITELPPPLELRRFYGAPPARITIPRSHR